MKAFVGVILVVGFIVACVHAHPRLPRNSDESDEKASVDTVLVLPVDSRTQLGTPDDDDGSDESMSDKSWRSYYYPSYPWTGSRDYFGDLYKSMNEMMRNLRNQMATALSRIPGQGIETWAQIPEGANTTSTTKVINGHVVTMNETTYKNGDSTLIRIRIIDVQPQNDTILLTGGETEAEATTATPSRPDQESTTGAKSVETVEEFDNEIPKGQVDTLTA